MTEAVASGESASHGQAGTRWLFRVALVAGAAVAVWARLRGLDAVFWRDEIKTRWVCGHGLAEIPGLLATEDVHPPLHYLLLKTWMTLLGDGDVTLRVFSLVVGLAVVGVGAYLAWRWWGRTACLVMLALSATAPGMAYLSLEVRNQAIVSLFLLGAVGGLWAWWQDGRRRWLVLYAAGAAAALYTHYLAWPAVLALALGFMGFVGGRRVLGNQEWWAANAVIILALLPWLGGLFQQLGNEAGLPEREEHGGAAAAARSITAFLAGADPLRAARVVLRTRLSSLGADAAALGLLALTALGLLHARRKLTVNWALVCLCAVLGVAAVVGTLHGTRGLLSHPRYFPMFSPLLLLAVTAALARLPRGWGLILVTGLVAVQAVVGTHTVRRAPVPWPEVVSYLEQEAGERSGPVLSAIWLGAEALRQYGYTGAALDLPFDLPAVEPGRARTLTAYPTTPADGPRLDRVLAGTDRFWLVTSTVDYDVSFAEDTVLQDYLRDRGWQEERFHALGYAEVRLFSRARAGDFSPPPRTLPGTS